MAESKNSERSNVTLPYMYAYGNITKVLERIQTATTPDRFTQDFLSTKLDLKGGTPKPVIPYLKRTSFLNGDGTPTELYQQFRNSASRGAASAIALKKGFGPLYEINEYAHDLTDKDLKGVIVQATGLDANSKVIGAILGSFKALRAFADFEASAPEPALANDAPAGVNTTRTPEQGGLRQADLKLGYTINLNLPATSDIAVFDAIFKSLREHLLD